MSDRRPDAAAPGRDERVRAWARLATRWRGVVLSLIGLTATLWLAWTGRLGLYIHPRYFVFTTVLAVVAVVLVVAATAVVGRGDGHRHTAEERHDHGEDGGGRSGLRRAVLVGGSLAVVVTALVAFLVVPPSTLTSATAAAREMNAGTVDAPAPVPADSAGWTVKDWAALLQQGESENFFTGRTATVTGFVSPDPDDPENVFYVSRFVVTCCAVDARPVGVPLYLPGWQDVHPVDSWVEVTGGFGVNPSAESSQDIVLVPTSITPVAEPTMPYVF